jgi:UDP-N-acetylmuramate dehydrogenase
LRHSSDGGGRLRPACQGPGRGSRRSYGHQGDPRCRATGACGQRHAGGCDAIHPAGHAGNEEGDAGRNRATRPERYARRQPP